MIDDRGKPPDGSGDDENVEILADAAVAARRRPTRKLRVPNDRVPRRVDAESDSGADAVASDDGAEKNGADAIVDDLPDDGATIPSVPVPARARVSVRPGASSPPRPASVSAPRTSVPPPPRVPSFQPPTPSLLRDEFDATETTVPSMSALDKSSSIRPPPGPSAESPAARSTVPGTPSIPPGAADDGGSVVRQVRRRIKSVGTGSKPPPPKPVVDDTPSVIVENADHGVPVPAVSSVDVGDDFAVPPVENAAEEKRANSDPPSVETEFVDGDIALDAVSDAEEEVLDEPTEEISIPDELLDRDRRPPVPAAARATVPDSPKKPPAPPPPPKAEKPAASAAAATTAPAQSKGREDASSSGRKKRRPWWEEMFNDDYFRTMPKYTPAQIKAEGDFIEQSLGVEKGAVVLDIACGDGRQAIELATRGYEMIALDLSLPMLSRAADAAQDREAKLNFLHSDMREMEFNEMFDAAYCTSTSFGYFEDDKNLDVAQRIHRALKVGGTLLLDVINRDYAIQSQPSMTWFEADGCVCMEETSFDYIKSRLQVKRTMIMDDGRQKEAEASIRLYSLHELGLMLHQSGFRIVEVSGSYRTAGAFFGAASKQIVILAQKQRRSEGTTATFSAAAATAAAAAMPAGGNGNGAKE
jgi:ubiquinone/menaquinone biosynthesis C-methylase UbiE